MASKQSRIKKGVKETIARLREASRLLQSKQKLGQVELLLIRAHVEIGEALDQVRVLRSNDLRRE